MKEMGQKLSFYRENLFRMGQFFLFVLHRVGSSNSSRVNNIKNNNTTNNNSCRSVNKLSRRLDRN